MVERLRSMTPPIFPSEDVSDIYHYLVNHEGVVPSELLEGDAVAGEVGRREIFNYVAPRWQKFLPVLDALQVRHPLDLRNAPPQIHSRIQELKTQILNDIPPKLIPNSSEWCDRFVNRFFTLGLRTYAEGGLGFAYPQEETFTYETFEMTAAEAYQAVVDPNNPQKEFGSCSEATYKILSALQAMDVSCTAYAVLVPGHVFAVAEWKEEWKSILDPSYNGRYESGATISTELDYVPDYYAQRAVIFEQQGHLEQALLDFEIAETYENRNVLLELLFLSRVNVLLQSGRSQAAIQAIEEYFELQPQEITFMLLLAEAYQLEGLYEKSLAVTIDALKKFDTISFSLRSKVHQRLADLYTYGTPRFEEARMHAMEAIRWNPDDPVAYKSLIAVFSEWGYYPKALTLVRKASLRFPEDTDFLAAKAHLLFCMNRKEEAQALNDKLLNIDPKHPIGLLTKAQLDIMAGFYLNAFDSIKLLGKRWGEYEWTHSELAYLNFLNFAHLEEISHGNPESILPKYLISKMGLALLPERQAKPGDQLHFYVKGLLLLQKRRTQTSDFGLQFQLKSLAEEMIKTWPHSNMGYHLLAYNEFMDGNLENAEILARESLKKWPYDGGEISLESSRKLLITILETQERFDEAKQEMATMEKMSAGVHILQQEE